MRDWMNRHFLLLTVFITGAAVLVIEIAALRILAPYYGNTIFTASSVISVILAALSLGYYIGGRLSDIHPHPKLFFGIITLAGFAVVLFHLLGTLVLPVMSGAFSITTGPLIAAVTLFLLPAILLGALSPYAIRLQTEIAADRGLGHVTGSVFFWSTLGSISGSLGAGFVLIPHFGLDEIIITTGAVLFLLGVLPLIRLGLAKHRWQDAMFVFALLCGGTALLTSMQAEGVVYRADGVYERLRIIDGTFDGREKRIFEQDRSSSGAIYLDSADPTEMAVDYTKYYTLYKIFAPPVRNALVIGGGAYAMPRALLAELPEARIDVAEIEPALYELAQKYFRLPHSPRLHNHVVDGRRLLRETDIRYDFIFSDVYYSLFSVPAHFTTREFFELAKNRLSENGVFAASIAGDLSRQTPSLIMSEIRTFRSVFPNSYFFAVGSNKRIDSQNILLVGINGDTRPDLTSPDILNHPDAVIRDLHTRRIDLDRYDLSRHKPLSDNYAPVAYMTGKVFQRSVRGPVLASCTPQSAPLSGHEMTALIDQQRGYGPDRDKLHDFLTAEMTALGAQISTQSWTDADGTARKNIIARFQPEKSQRVLLAARWDAHPSAVAVLADLARVLATGELPTRSGIDVVFMDYGGDSHFTYHLEQAYPGNLPDSRPVSGIALGPVCNTGLTIAREEASRMHAGKELDHFWMIAQGVDDNLFIAGDGKRIHGVHDALNSAGIPTFLLSDANRRKRKNPPCNPAKLENTARAMIDYLYKIR